MGHAVSIETREKLSIAGKKRTHSPETRAKMSLSHMGNKNLLGFHHSDVSKLRISRALMGNTYTLGFCPSAETREKMGVAHWRGGRPVATRKESAKRRALGFTPLNGWFLGCEGHHVDNEKVIYMPKALHRSIYHRQTDGMGMEKINAVAYNFLFKQEVEMALGRKK